MCLQKFPPQFADFPKSATGQLPQLPTCACRNSPPSLQIFQNLPLDSYLSTYMCLQKFCPPFGDFPKSATGQLLKLPTCPCRNSPPQFADFLKSATGQLPKLPTCACRNSPPFGDFPKSATGQLPKLPTCACRNSPHLEIF